MQSPTRDEDDDDFDRDRPSRSRRRDDDDDDRPSDRRGRRRADDDDDDDEYEDRRRRKGSSGYGGAEFIVPVDVNPMSLIACYVGLVSCILPGLGVLVGAIAVFLAFKALKKRKKKSEGYGGATGDARAIVGLIAGGMSVLGWGLATIGFVIAQLK